MKTIVDIHQAKIKALSLQEFAEGRSSCLEAGRRFNFYSSKTLCCAKLHRRGAVEYLVGWSRVHNHSGALSITFVNEKHKPALAFGEKVNLR